MNSEIFEHLLSEGIDLGRVDLIYATNYTRNPFSSRREAQARTHQSDETSLDDEEVENDYNDSNALLRYLKEGKIPPRLRVTTSYRLSRALVSLEGILSLPTLTIDLDKREFELDTRDGVPIKQIQRLQRYASDIGYAYVSRSDSCAS